MKLLHSVILSFALAVGAGVVLAQDFQKGLAAYGAGDYTTALEEWRPLAKQEMRKLRTILVFYMRKVLA